MYILYKWNVDIANENNSVKLLGFIVYNTNNITDIQLWVEYTQNLGKQPQ